MTNSTRRRFLINTGLAGLSTSMAGSTMGATAGSELAPAQDDPTVKRYAGPFGEGLPITLAGYDYSRTAALVDGRVGVEGCQTRFEVTGIGPLNNHAFFGPQKREVTEIGLIPYILAYANDEFRDYVLLPIPVLRVFRHKSIWVRTDAGIEKPEDLKGRRVATVGYSSSGLTHVRGWLAEEYGVRPEDIEWVSTKKDSAANLTGGVSAWEKVRPEGVKIIDGPEEEDESSLLLSGQVDAILHPAEPRVYQERNPMVRRLFEDHRSVEQDFYRRTGIFPIMHTVAIRRDVAKQHPWLPKAVFEAYSKAKTADFDHMRKLGWAYDTLPWYGQEFNETRDLMGNNFYPYGLKASAKSYDAALRYTFDQGLSKRRVSLEEMFEPSTLDLEEPPVA